MSRDARYPAWVAERPPPSREERVRRALGSVAIALAVAFAVAGLVVIAAAVVLVVALNNLGTNK